MSKPLYKNYKAMRYREPGRHIGISDTKVWSYQDLTDVIERELTNLVHQADRVKDREGKLVVRQWAFGMFSFWSSLTVAHRAVEDFERLEKIAEAVGTMAGHLEHLDKLTRADG